MSIGDPAHSEDNVLLYPNPSQGSFTIDGINESTCMEIIDVSGRRVACIKLAAGAAQAVDVSYLPAGSYTVRAVMSSDVITKKLMITR